MKRGTIAVAAGGIVLCGLLATALLLHQAGPGRAGATGPGQITIGGPFALIDGQGKTVRDTDFRGRFMLVYFGYTHCPDACPTMLSDMAAALDKLPAADRARAVPIFISVDPDRDTPALMGEYAAAFGPSFIGLTGSQAAVTRAERGYRVYAARHPLKNGDYAMDHSSVLYVMGPDGGFRGAIDESAKPVTMVQQLLSLGV